MPDDTAEYTQWAVQYRYPDDTNWYDTVDSPLHTLGAARSYRAWYDREVGLHSRIVQTHIRVTVIHR